MAFVHDIIIVGAGPSGLGVAARLCEQTPAENYTDAEHGRYHWIRKNKFNNLVQSQRKKKKAAESATTTHRASAPSRAEEECNIGQRLGEYHTLVIDATSTRFMARWDHLFGLYAIDHLRSPMFFHIDPSDRDGLLAYAEANNRYKSECIEIKGVVGQEISRHAKKQRAARAHKHQAIGKDTNIDERERRDYFVPSTELFHDHCRSLVDKYNMDEERLIIQDSVSDIQYGIAEEILPDGVQPTNQEHLDKIFKVKTWNGEHYTKAVVLAIGPSMPWDGKLDWPDNCCHSSQIGEFPSIDVQQKIKLKMETNVMIVGGGLTSAQIALRAIGKGVSKVWLIMRGPLKIKHFDMTLEWVGKFKNQEKATFWSADTDEERYDMIKTARNGGSIPLRYKKLLDEQVAKGRLVISTHTSLRNICKNAGDLWKTQTITTEPPIKDLPAIDFVYFATGPRSALNQLTLPDCCTHDRQGDCADTALPVPFLETMQRQYGIHWINGLPVLNNDLAWTTVEPENGKRTIPLYMTGTLAALRLGPGAANLEGARSGAERVVWGIQETIGTELTNVEQLAHGLNAYLTGDGGRFDGLSELDDD